jgi:hypothetical protein
MKLLKANITFGLPDDFKEPESIAALFEAIAAHIRSNQDISDRQNVPSGASHHIWFYNLSKNQAKLTGEIGIFSLENGKNWIEILPKKSIVF